MKKLFLGVLMAGSSFWANAQAQVVVAWYYQEWSITQDSLNYKYNTGTNQLQYITDNVLATVSTTDIDNQNPNNYIYDKSGNMVADNSQSMSVSWSPYGKILQTNKAGGANLQFGYNAMQQRVLKRVVTSGDTVRTYYIRDAQGNTMGVYTRHNDSVTWREQYIFGSSRLGLYRADTLVNKGLTVISKLYEGKRNYELTNHLGNVLAVINDRKTDSLSGTTKVGFNAVVISGTDYYPFGMAMDSRNFSLKTYRYSFNDKEIDSETGYQDYGMRMYDGKNPHFLSIDPLTKKYPFYSPYIFAGDNPIMATDLDGAEPNQAVTDNKYQAGDIKLNSGDYYKDGHNYMKIQSNGTTPEYWIRHSIAATTYGDISYEYWNGKDYVPYLPNGYSDKKMAFKNNAIGLGYYGRGVETGVNISVALMSGGGAAEVGVVGVGLRSLAKKVFSPSNVGSAVADFSSQYTNQLMLNGGDGYKALGNVNFLSTVAQLNPLGNRFTAALSSSILANSFSFTIDKGFQQSDFNSELGKKIGLGTVGNLFGGIAGKNGLGGAAELRYSMFMNYISNETQNAINNPSPNSNTNKNIPK